MGIFGDLTTLVTLAIAVFIFFRLRAVLGKRTGHQRPPFDPNEARREKPAVSNGNGENVVTLPSRRRGGEENAHVTVADTIAKPGTKLNDQLRELVAADRDFDPERFIEGAKMAYEMIVTAFADGDRKTLRNLLSREVYEGFANALSERESRGEEIRSSFVGIDSADIRAAEISGGDAHVTVRFVSQIISATYNGKGELIDGDPDQIAEVIDIWTFARDIRSKDPNWKLVATGSEN